MLPDDTVDTQWHVHLLENGTCKDNRAERFVFLLILWAAIVTFECPAFVIAERASCHRLEYGEHTWIERCVHAGDSLSWASTCLTASQRASHNSGAS